MLEMLKLHVNWMHVLERNTWYDLTVKKTIIIGKYE